MFSEVVLILGGNKGDRESLLAEAVKRISGANELLLQSRIYETEAWGGVAKGPFLNQVVQVRTDRSPMDFLCFIQQIEAALGRTREDHWGDRTMDIDILFIGQSVLNLPELKVPHPYLAERKFVLVPLVEILPGFIHPVSQKTAAELLAGCKDKGDVQLFK